MSRFCDVVDGMLDRNIPFFIYRLPDSRTIQCGYQNNAKKSGYDNDSDKRHKGFLFVPFDSNQKYYIEVDKLFDITDSAEELILEIKDLFMVKQNDILDAPFPDSKEEYLRKCKRYIQEIKCGRAQKAILSRVISNNNLTRGNASRLFDGLNINYPSAFVFLVHIPGLTTWIGASPEILLKARNGHFQTYSLAGTKEWHEGETNQLKNWGEKDKKEQLIVTDYIGSLLSALPIRNLQRSELKIKRAANVCHLLTEFEGDASSAMIQDLPSRLHPTPAVCGSPTDAAFEMIREIENYPREFYAGYLGYTDEDGNCDLYVNLRCARLMDQGGYLYVGGGITSDSDPESEWSETCLKARTILNIIEE